MTLLGGIEAGGTKFVCGVARTVDGGSGRPEIVARARFDTTRPEETIGQAVQFFREQPEAVAAVGIAAFGPLDLNPQSATYGFITSTPKRGWQQTDLLGEVQRALDVPAAIDTDVNAAAVGEWRWGAAAEQGIDDVLYITVGTGIGGGALVAGRAVHGVMHPEIGHIPIRHEADDPFQGVCPFHGDCLEGLAAGPAMRARWGRPADHLPTDHPAWDLEARYLAHGLVACILTLAPRRIILGGGVMQQAQLFPLIRGHVQRLLNGYLTAWEVGEGIAEYIVPPGLGGDAGVLGAVALVMATDG